MSTFDVFYLLIAEIEYILFNRYIIISQYKKQNN